MAAQIEGINYMIICESNIEAIAISDVVGGWHAGVEDDAGGGNR